MKLIVEDKYKHIFNKFNHEIDEYHNENSKLVFGYQNIITNNENIMKNITNNGKYESDKIYVCITYGIGSFNTKNIITEVKTDNIRMKLRRNQQQQPEILPITSNFVLIYYISITNKEKFYNVFSSTIPVNYDIIKEINKNNNIYTDIQISELSSINYEEVIYDSLKHCSFL